MLLPLIKKKRKKETSVPASRISSFSRGLWNGYRLKKTYWVLAPPTQKKKKPAYTEAGAVLRSSMINASCQQGKHRKGSILHDFLVLHHLRPIGPIGSLASNSTSIKLNTFGDVKVIFNFESQWIYSFSDFGFLMSKIKINGSIVCIIPKGLGRFPPEVKYIVQQQQSNSN